VGQLHQPAVGLTAVSTDRRGIADGCQPMMHAPDSLALAALISEEDTLHARCLQLQPL